MHVYIYDHSNILLASNILNRGNTKKKFEFPWQAWHFLHALFLTIINIWTL